MCHCKQRHAPNNHVAVLHRDYMYWVLCRRCRWLRCFPATLNMVQTTLLDNDCDRSIDGDKCYNRIHTGLLQFVAEPNRLPSHTAV